MKEINDEELQKLIEQQFTTGLKPDASLEGNEQLYTALFNILSEQPELPEYSSLADNVVNVIEREASRKESVRYGWAIAGVIAGSLIFLAAALLLINPVELTATFISLKSNIGIASFIAVAITVIEIMDRNLVKKRITNY